MKTFPSIGPRLLCALAVAVVLGAAMEARAEENFQEIPRESGAPVPSSAEAEAAAQSPATLPELRAARLVDDSPEESLQAADRAEAQSGGDALILEAYELTRTVKTVADYTKVLEMCRRAVRSGLSKESDGYAKRLMGWAFNRRGELLADQRHDSVALSDFEEAVRNDPTRWRAIHNRGISYALIGQHRKAISDFNRTLELNPRHANAYFNRGEVRYEIGQFETAVKDYTKAIALAPNDAAAHNSRGHANYRLGKYRQSVRDFTNAIRLKPKMAVAHVNRGDLYSDLGFYEKAVRDYREAVRLDPKLGRAYQSAAWVMATCPDPQWRSGEGALETVAKAAQYSDGNDHRLLATEAAAQANAGDFRQAKKTVTRALHLAPKVYHGEYETQLALYKQLRPFRAKPRPVPPIAGKSKDGPQQASFEEPKGKQVKQGGGKKKKPSAARRRASGTQKKR